MSNCCGPSRGSAEATPLRQPAALGRARGHVRAEAHISAGTFLMGDHFDEGYATDGETPLHRVELSSYSIDATTVTNAQFAEFVTATGYRTESEIFGFSAVFHLATKADPADIQGTATGTPWWHVVRGADWAHPAGPKSTWEDIPDHPVVQVSWNDAISYCHWADCRLPTEAEWEYAARGGLEGRRYPWGNELQIDGQHLCNIWQGEFPARNTQDDGFLTTAPVRQFPSNGFGLYEVSGNVWEWCSDWFLPKYYRNSPTADPQGPTIGMGRVMRGGSYLCHDSYCNRYRVAARSYNTADSASGNIGFRTVAL
ncbi:formylglycine-generating enzyme family protein [Arthrobacter crystallopoietes]|uniref:Formylglycine-generating enzyme, required for sulfatase activity, contains SUMF1/FGE domain n=1 Tax=Crystallibacter crystallopoietes TaxID=37928 RepID=A0A1H1BZR8_9MICC|nr:sulfatase modifying factor 1 (C-alpha-formyglycine- generating enzyme 1) [Arthrobacter crystallopoietes]SDQ57414.1 Formylglycine-generating enzyme, required for sulfatase activity, contains SUMF1/FGE domain [Arthrobacter crystallopoietes]